jgi:hypothetical protein
MYAVFEFCISWGVSYRCSWRGLVNTEVEVLVDQ